MSPATTSDWNLKAEFEAPDRVIITVRDSVILTCRSGSGLDVTGSLLLKQAKPDCVLIVTGNTCGIQTTGTLTIAIDHISVSASNGPAMQSGGNVTADNFLSASLSGAKPLCCDGDINMTARAVPTASITVHGGICSNGNVVLRADPTICPANA